MKHGNLKKILFFVIFLMMTTIASAQSLFYIKGALGPSSQGDSYFFNTDIDFRTAGVGTILFAMGINVGPMFSTEIEFSSRSIDIYRVDGIRDRGALDSSAFMINGVFNVPLQYGYSLNLGAGLGVLSAEITDGNTGEFADGSTLGMQFMIGGEASVTENLSVTLEYKHLRGFDLELSGFGAFAEAFDYKNQSVLIGLKYLF